MKIGLNGDSTEVHAQLLDAALKELGYEEKTFATAVNGTFVPESERGSYLLSDGDCIEIVVPMQGG